MARCMCHALGQHRKLRIQGGIKVSGDLNLATHGTGLRRRAVWQRVDDPLGWASVVKWIEHR